MLSPIVVTGIRTSGATLAAKPRRKPARRPAPRRRAAPKPAPKRRARPAPKKTPRDIPLKKIASIAIRKFPLGRAYELAESLYPYVWAGLQQIMGGPITIGFKPTPDLPFVVGTRAPAKQVAPPMSTLESIVVTGKSSPLSTSSPLQAPKRSPGRSPRRSQSMRPATAKTTKPGLTPQKTPRAQYRRGVLEALQPFPVPKEELDEDPCKATRKRQRNKCPARGYRLRATAWRKEPCQ